MLTRYPTFEFFHLFVSLVPSWRIVARPDHVTAEQKTKELEPREVGTKNLNYYPSEGSGGQITTEEATIFSNILPSLL